MKSAMLALILTIYPLAANAQQYRNLEIQPDGSGGYTGTYGGQNFQIAPDYSKPVPRNSARRAPGNPPAVFIPNEGVNGNTQKQCYTTGNGTVICR